MGPWHRPRCPPGRREGSATSGRGPPDARPHLPKGLHQHLQVQRLGDGGEDAGGHRTRGARARDDDDRNALDLRFLFQALHQLPPRHHRHHQIQDHHPRGGLPSQPLQCIEAVDSGLHREALFCQVLLQHFAAVDMILDEEDVAGVRHGLFLDGVRLPVKAEASTEARPGERGGWAGCWLPDGSAPARQAPGPGRPLAGRWARPLLRLLGKEAVLERVVRILPGFHAQGHVVERHQLRQGLLAAEVLPGDAQVLAQRAGQVGAGEEAVSGIRRECPVHGGAQGLGHRARGRLPVRPRVVADAPEQLLGALALGGIGGQGLPLPRVEGLGPLEEVPAGEQLEQDDAQGELIRARLQGEALRELGGGIGQAALPLGALAAQAPGQPGPGHAELQQLHRPVLADEDVVGRHVAVDDAQRAPVLVRERVRVVQGLGHLRHHVAGKSLREGLLGPLRGGQHRLQPVFRHVLQQQQGRIVRPLERVHGQDVGVAQLRGDAGFLHQSAPRLLAASRRRALDDGVAAKGRAIPAAHEDQLAVASRPQPLDELIGGVPGPQQHLGRVGLGGRGGHGHTPKEGRTWRVWSGPPPAVTCQVPPEHTETTG
ncbi:hypothetical protein STIAU_0546 [Stigmatella aurantiaca DW4/3-1]|uniref:Uncharacterized protein n=1 Tax=Stigmatella aurantiaca (strain DW4/3-1) TaxID=378806 RepID=Q091Q7_STIAD|nr:hypothetical protein STIAU_0546 [Stigmatella aurantiaca DW4/3-1]